MGNCLNLKILFRKIIILFLFFFLGLGNSFSQKKAKIEFLGSDALYGFKKNGISGQRVIGNARFKHDGALMLCDSAYFYPGNNSMEAFGSIQVNQLDGSVLYGDRLEYDGNTKVAVVTGKEVKLVAEDFELITNRLIFNRLTNITSYYTGAVITSKTDDSVLESKRGYFLTDQSLFKFKDSVVVTNPEYTINSDTLWYNSATKLVDFLGPTVIKGEDNLIYCENGWYNAKTDHSKYFKNAYIISDGKRMEGDTLFYDRNIGYGQVDWNIRIIDTAENIIISGEHGRIYEKKDSAVVTDNSLLTQIFDNDTISIHADTFKVYRDSQGKQFLFAYYGVKIFKSDLQGSCDSISYSISDSSIRMYENPILWSAESQLTADSIEIRIKNSKIHSLYLDRKAFIISEIDTLRYNQIRGRNMTGYFSEGKLKTIFVKGNGQTTYYGQDDLEKFIGVNIAESSDIRIVLGESKIESITFLGKPKSKMHPMGELDPIIDLRYPGFKWLDEYRPKTRESLFVD